MSDLKKEARELYNYGNLNLAQCEELLDKATIEGYKKGHIEASLKAEAEAEMFYMKRMDKAVLEERQERDTHWKNELRNRYQKGVEAERKRIKKLLDEKIVGKGEDEMFDQGAYEENRQIYKAIKS